MRADLCSKICTSTKLLLLCGLFVGSIVLATYSLIREQQIAIHLSAKSF